GEDRIDARKPQDATGDDRGGSRGAADGELDTSAGRLREAVEVRARADVDAVVDDGGSGECIFAEVVDAERFPLRAGLDHGDLAFLAAGVELAIAGDGRGV